MDKYRAQMLDYSDEYLMRLLQDGNAKALDELYRRYSHRMLAYFYRMLGQQEEIAQDYLQDLFVKLIDKAHLFQAEKKFSSWLYALAGNMCKNTYRSWEVRKIMLRLESTVEKGDEGPGKDNLMDCELFQQQLNQALGSLSSIHREVFVLKYQEDLSIKEISQIMNCAEGTVKSRLFYSLKKLAEQLQSFKVLLKSS